MKVALVIFARAPRAGEVKTRLIPALGAAGAAALYQALLMHALTLARAAPVDTRLLYAADADARDEFATRAGMQGFDLAVQATGDLGTRMHAACADALRSHEAVLLIGSDLLDSCAGDLPQAVRWIEQDADVVLGPVADGGYWLIGLRAARADLFDRLPWGTGSVYAQTVAALAATRTPWRALPLRHDIDEPGDLLAHAKALARLRQQVI